MRFKIVSERSAFSKVGTEDETFSMLINKVEIYTAAIHGEKNTIKQTYGTLEMNIVVMDKIKHPITSI